jgi:hypothetical protein
LITQTKLINDSWTASTFSSTLFTRPDAHDLISLNSHFDHYRFFPNDYPNYVFSTQVTQTTSYSGTIAFSVGCHSGLSLPDAGEANPTDWAQAFLRQRATFIGNTGFGYGDYDRIAYSERLMVYFVEELGYIGEGPQTVGRALLRAKQRYFNNASGGTFSNYDEKTLGIMTLYGLPMLGVNMPNPTATPPGGPSVVNPAAVTQVGAQDVVTSAVNLSFSYTPHTASTGRYYTIAGEDDVFVAKNRPEQPRTSRDIHLPDTLVHGALIVGGTFNDVNGFDPIVSRVITDDQYAATEPLFPAGVWFPTSPGTVNRFLGIDGEAHERLVVVPAQFRATEGLSPTVGVERLYTNLQFELYHAPFDAADFIAPIVWQASGTRSGTGTTITFNVVVADPSSGSLPVGEGVQRVVVLYRTVDSAMWSKLELTYNAAAQTATGSVSNPEFVDMPVEFFVQAVDVTGNVALALDYGNPFVIEQQLHLPLIRR